MGKTSRPHRGSTGILPRKRAKRQRPRIRSWITESEVKPLGFSGYKAGMTHIIAVDETKNSPTSGMEVFLPVTIVETPPMTVVGVRVYSKGYEGLEAAQDIWMSEPAKQVQKRAPIKGDKDGAKKVQDLKNNLDTIADIRLILYTHPFETHTPQKKPDVMEMALGGDINSKIEYAAQKIGTQMTVEEVFGQNQYVDVKSVTKGKGFQGVIKRYGLRRQIRKSAKGRRHIGSGGSWVPARKLWTEPLPGQMGYHSRTEYNKLILSIGKDGAEITPKGGFLHYGPVKNNYVMIHGSIPGPAKRVVRLLPARRVQKEESYNILKINTESKQGNR
ncbi:MAG TPA: 50S ribosomal protein L3 [Candidatus Altiarchaeales archaeon]|nr:50S ribosomal protein L3 [Candidatus Altiarchaeales archaeon]